MARGKTSLALTACLCLCILGFSACDRASQSGLNPGEYPPAIELPTLNGEVRKLEDFRGKVVLLNFWASWCVPCVQEMPALQSLYDQLRDKGLVVAAVGVDDAEDALREFQRKFALSFPLLVDKSGTVKSRYRLAGVPESFVIGRDGKLVMLPDPDDGMPVIKIIGPRDWSSPRVVNLLTQLLEDKN